MTSENVRAFEDMQRRQEKRRLLEQFPANFKAALEMITNSLISANFRYVIMNGNAYGENDASERLHLAAMRIGEGLLHLTRLDYKRKEHMIESVFIEFVRAKKMVIEQNAAPAAAPQEP